MWQQRDIMLQKEILKLTTRILSLAMLWLDSVHKQQNTTKIQTYEPPI